jgi:protein TonB
MSTALVARAIRQAIVLSGIAGVHLGAFALVSLGLLPSLTKPDTGAPLFMFREPPVPTLIAKPDVFLVGDYEGATQPEPDIRVPSFWDSIAGPAGPGDAGAGKAGGARGLPSADLRPPGLRTRDSRVKALIDSCYPAASRRHSEEGRVVAHVVVGSDGRPVTWAVDQGSGFPRLDAAAECVVRRLEFVAGQRDGRAVEAPVRLPIVFRLE